MDITAERITSELVKRKEAVSRMGSLVTIGFGLALLGIAGAKAMLNYEYQFHGIETVATVTSSSYSYSRGTSYHTVSYVFRIPGGRTVMGNQTGYSGAKGSSILVSYLPSHPSFNRVAGSEQRDRKWLPWVSVAGAFFLFVGIQSYLKQKRTASS